MKLKFSVQGMNQPDPFIFRDDDGKFYIYTTGVGGVQGYSADSLTDEWKYEGTVFNVPHGYEYWAPSVIKLDGKYYMYVSFCIHSDGEFMHVAVADRPLGPFGDVKRLYNRFTIDSHVVQTSAGLFLWYAENNEKGDRVGTRVFVDKLLDPFTPANICKEVIVPTLDEEISVVKDTGPWHTIEGPFWFREGDWQYVMYSGGAFRNDTYHIGYAAAKSDEEDLTKVDFVKFTDNGKFCPTMFRNDVEEGVGHHSVIKVDGQYYAIYHARDGVKNAGEGPYVEARTARICKLHVKDGRITAERMD